jgi:transcription initiation factor TFIID subunit 2
MDALNQYESFHFYANPVDPVRDGCPTYRHVISRPMDLGTVRTNLKTGRYHTIDQWKSDMNLIWTNCIRFNGRQSIMALAALHLEFVFNQLTQTLTDDQSADWRLRFQSLSSHLTELVGAVPQSIGRSPLSPPPKPTPKEPPPPPQQPKGSGQKPDESANSKARGRPPAKGKGSRTLTGPELEVLVAQVNGLKRDDHLVAVIDLLRKCEPAKVFENQVECAIEDFSPNTHLELRKLVTQLLEQAGD